MVANKFSIREQNQTLVLSKIIQNPAISRAAISQQTGLNKASTSEIVKQLIDDQLVIEIGSGDSTSVGGRRPILLQINQEAGCSLSIEVGYDFLSSMLTNLSGECIAETHESNVYITKESIQQKVREVMAHYAPHMEDKPYPLIGITLAIHGIVHENLIRFTPYYDLDMIDLANVLEEEWGVPVFLENEANLTALGEKTFATEEKNLVSVSIHKGVGAGITINGTLYRGSHGQGGEIGHMIVDPDGIPCPCGNKGCIEQYCSESAILLAFQEVSGKSDATLTDIADYYQKNDPSTRSLIEGAVSYLSIGLNNVIGNFDPDQIILNSSLFEQLPFLLPQIKAHMTNAVAKNIPLHVSRLRNRASLFGGAALNLQQFFHIEDLHLQAQG